MFTKSKKFAMLAVLGLAAFAPGIGATSALSFPMVPPSGTTDAQSGEIVSVQFTQRNYSGRPLSWQSQRDGIRCRTRMGNCQHFHQGFYYQNPWWVLPLVVGGAIAHSNQGGGTHVQWCMSHYRSYNARTDTWLGYDGLRHRCISGY